jgi:GT2 family glycosyltransferase
MPDKGGLGAGAAVRAAASAEKDGDASVAAPAVAAVVLDWNGGSEAVEAVESLVASRYPNLRIILVDNGSRIPVIAEVRRRHAAVMTIANDVNLGYAGGNNVGIRAGLAAGAAYVLVLNNDARVRPDTVAALVEVARRDDRVAAVGAKILRADRPDRLWMAWGEVTWRQSLVRLVGQDRADGPSFAVERDVEWVSGCGLLLSRRALAEIGLFDEDFFAYHEEVDWCARARARGLRVVYTPRAEVLHRGEGSSGGSRYVSRKQYFAGRNMVLFARRHGRPRERVRFALAVAATLPFQYLRRRLRGEQAGVLLKIRGMRDALAGRPIPRAELGLDG